MTEEQSAIVFYNKRTIEGAHSGQKWMRQNEMRVD